MKVYSDEKNINMVQSVASASTLISSVASEIRDYVISKFPENYFKSIYIDTSETLTQQRKNDKYNKNLNKIPYPSLAITPELSLESAIDGMDKSFQLSSPNLFLRKDINRTYKKIIIDPDNRIALYYTSDYITTNFNFKITTNSFIQNADMAFFIKSSFQSGMFQYLNERLIQAEIPKTFIKIISKILGYNLSQKEDMDALRLYLIGTNKLPKNIVKKTNLNTGKTCFFVDDVVNFLTVTTDIDAPTSIVREGQVEGEYTLNFRVQVSTWIPNAFILSVDGKVLEKHNIDTEKIDDEKDNDLSIYTTTITRKPFTKTLAETFLDNNGESHIGQLIYSNTFTYRLHDEITSVDFLEVLPSDFQEIYEYATNPNNNLNIDPSALVYLKVADFKGVIPSDQYTIKYVNEESSVFSSMLSIEFNEPVESDFAIGIYVNRELYESLQKAKETNVNYFGSTYLTSMLINVGNGKSENVLIRKFTSDAELHTTDVEKSLRIQTPYGVGYISLVEPTDKKDEIRICLANGRIMAMEKTKFIKVDFIVEGKSIGNKTVRIGDTYGIIPSNPTKKGMTFAGWYDKNSKRITSNSEVTIAEDHTLVAKFV